MGITIVPIRAAISVGNLVVETPDVLSFNVRRARGQISTFDASLKIEGGSTSSIGGSSKLEIRAGIGAPTNLIFSGIVTQARFEACYDDPGYVILSLSGKDIMLLLEGKKFTRRCRASMGVFATINDVSRSGFKSGKFACTNLNTLTLDPGVSKNPLTTATIIQPIPGVGSESQSNSPSVKLNVTNIITKQ